MAERLVIVRHGETEWSRERRHTGRTDLPLTDNGRAQAQRLRGVLNPADFSAVFTSPLARARETARLAGFAAPQVDADLEEWDYGRYDGLTLADIREQRPDWDLWRDGPDGGETLADVVRRVDGVIERMRAIDGSVLIFAHGHVLRILTARWLLMAGSAGQRFALSPASVCVLGYEHDWTALLHWNMTPD